MSVLTPEALDTIEAGKRSRRDAELYHRRLMERGLIMGGMEQEIASLKEQVATTISDEDRPLWRRITNQRRALRVEIFWRKLFEKNWRESEVELRRLRTENERLRLFSENGHIEDENRDGWCLCGDEWICEQWLLPETKEERLNYELGKVLNKVEGLKSQNKVSAALHAEWRDLAQRREQELVAAKRKINATLKEVNSWGRYDTVGKFSAVLRAALTGEATE